MPRIDPILPPSKTRRHSNNKGQCQIKQGKTRTQVDAMAKRLAKSERALLQAVIVAIHPEPSPVFADDLTPTMREMAVTQWRYDRMRAVESAEKAIKVVRRHDTQTR